MIALKQALLDSLGLGLTVPRSSEEHLQATMAWLSRAQDVAGNGGVSRMYHLKNGWGAAYPETTGYIIPTFLDYARWSGKGEFRDRALRMADWESDIQMADGAVQGGTVADKPTPAIFNTGQVLFGWCDAFVDAGNPRHRESLSRAADYLTSMQDSDGAWRRNLSAFCDALVDSYAYNIRTAWALWLASAITGQPEHRNGAIANLDYVLTLAHSNGWIEKNCLNDPSRPLLHTIAYTQQGMLELGLLTGNRVAVERVIKGSEALQASLKRHGQLYGRYDANWTPRVKWRCITGEAQTAIVWYRLAEVTGDKAWHSAARELTTGLKRVQVLGGKPDTAGGIKGSHPVYGWYGKYEYLNWAAKFYADVLMLDVGYQLASMRG